MKNIKTNLKESLSTVSNVALIDYLEKLKYKYRLNNNWVFIEDNARTIDLPSDFFDVLNSFHVERVEFTNCKEVELNNQTNISNIYVYVSGTLILDNCKVSNCTLSCKENLEIKKSANPKVCIFEDAILKAKEFMQKINTHRVKFTNTKSSPIF